MSNKIINDLEDHKADIKDVLTRALLSFAFITGKYEIEGSKYELANNYSYLPDIDIVIFEN